MSEVRKNIEFLKEQKWINLSHEVHESIPYFAAFRPIKTDVLATIEEDGFYAQNITIATQYGTHIDAPFHFAKGKRQLEDIELKERVLPLYVIHKEDEVENNHDYSVSVEDIKKFEEEHGKIEEGSFVAFSSGWSDRFREPEKYYNEDEEGISRTPGWSLEALKFLHGERNVQAIGHETLNTDSGEDFAKNQGLEAELYWLSQDKYQVEVLNNLKEVPSTGAVISIGVPRIKGAAGFSAEVTAIVPKD